MRCALGAVAIWLLTTSLAIADINGTARVIDGDTIKIGEQCIRLFGIDAPELGTKNGVLARTVMARIIGDNKVSCEDTGGRTYNRVVAICTAGGKDIASEIVRLGWAWDWPKFSLGHYKPQELEAWQARRGLWRDVK